MTGRVTTADGDDSLTTESALPSAWERTLSAAQQAVALRPIPMEAIQSGGAAAVALALKIDAEKHGARVPSHPPTGATA